eukprot:scaffold3208_cov134-Skeletonema_dohrnii-CCMP3373.AAC.6
MNDIQFPSKCPISYSIPTYKREGCTRVDRTFLFRFLSLSRQQDRPRDEKEVNPGPARTPPRARREHTHRAIRRGASMVLYHKYVASSLLVLTIFNNLQACYKQASTISAT